MKKGDKVIITKKVSKPGFGWHSYMDDILGKEVTVKSTGVSLRGDKNFTIEESCYTYSIECVDSAVNLNNYEIY